MQEVYENVPLKKHLANVQLESFPEMSNEYDESILKMYAKFNNLRDEVLGSTRN